MSAPAAAPAPAPAAQGGALPWVAVCHVEDLLPERGAAALVHGEQVALFLLADGSVRAVQQQDPFTGSNVMSRGLVGTRGERPTVASPLHKQVFDLDDGTCLEPPGGPGLRVWDVRLDHGVVLVGGRQATGSVVTGPAVTGPAVTGPAVTGPPMTGRDPAATTGGAL